MFLKIAYPPSSGATPKQRCRKKEYVAKIQECLSAIQPLDGDIYVSAKFYPENYYFHRGDLDNLMKTLLDAIKGKCFYDDSQVRALYSVMMDSAPNDPHVEVRVERHSHSSIKHFNNREAENENYTA